MILKTKNTIHDPQITLAYFCEAALETLYVLFATRRALRDTTIALYNGSAVRRCTAYASYNAVYDRKSAHQSSTSFPDILAVIHEWSWNRRRDALDCTAIEAATWKPPLHHRKSLVGSTPFCTDLAPEIVVSSDRVLPVAFVAHIGCSTNLAIFVLFVRISLTDHFRGAPLHKHIIEARNRTPNQQSPATTKINE
jgi:hypothetical protein